MTYHSDTLAFKKSELLAILQAIDNSFTFDNNQSLENGTNSKHQDKGNDDTVEIPKQLQILAKNYYFTVFDAACFISLDEPDICHDINYNDDFRYGEHKQAVKVIENGIKAKKLEIDFEGEIPKDSLQKFMLELGYVIEGLNDNLSSQNQSNFSNPLIQQLPPDIEELNTENVRLKTELAQAQERIKQLEAEQSSEGEKPNNLLDLIFDETAEERYAPDLVLAIKLWEHIYINNPKDNSHSNKADTWLNGNTGYDTVKKAGSASKIREITTPFIKWGATRDKNYKK